MVFFGEHRWLLVNSYSRFEAYIRPQDSRREQVMWTLQMRYFAHGAIWRRVKDWERPSLWLQVNSFTPPRRHWTDLENLNFWRVYHEEEEPLEWKAGWLDVSYYPRNGDHAPEQSFIVDHLWRVGARDGGFFTVELAGFAGGQNLTDLFQVKVPVTSSGKEAGRELDAEKVREHAALYLVENIPFGTVRVLVPRNARDPENYALQRARQLIGVEEPEHVTMWDFTQHGNSSECLHGDLYVTLHFNGHYED